MKEVNKIILYQDDDEITRVSVRFADEDLWLTQNQLADIYCTTQENISMHIRNIYADRELDENRTYKKFLLVRQEGNRQVKRNIDHYNLDMVIALGYRVQSQIATRFRRWATLRLHEYIQKGFAMDDAVMTGVESRSSSPVRMDRDSETLQSLTVKGLYPSGEGAGFAGGIVSAGIDGIKCAEAMIKQFQKMS